MSGLPEIPDKDGRPAIGRMEIVRIEVPIQPGDDWLLRFSPDSESYPYEFLGSIEGADQ